MSISSEKAEIIKRFEQINHVSLIQAIKNLLDFGLSKQMQKNKALEESIDKGLIESKEGTVRRHKEVMAELRECYKA